MAKKPNIVLIFVDNQPAKMLGCAGNDEVHTPNLDKLASEGVRFSEAFCPNAMCSPCRASVLTGLMPSQHGIHTWLDDEAIASWPENWNAIEEFETLPELLSDASYDTALVGKYHLGMAEEPQNGFKHWVTMQIGHVLSFYDNKMIENGKRFTHPGHSVEFFTEKAVDFITAHNDAENDPYFLFLTYPAPYGHWPSIQGEPTNHFKDQYKDTAFHSVPREAVSKELVDWILLRHKKAYVEEFEFYSDLLRVPNDLPTLRNYYSQMSMVDEGVGKVLSAIDQSSQGDNTLVIYTSDHGMSLGEHGFWGHGEDTWPSNTHREANNIPLIVRPPTSTQSGQVRESLVHTTDIFATVLDYAGLEQPAEHPSPAKSLKPLIEGNSLDWENCLFIEQEETRSVRTKNWLFMKRFGPTDYALKNSLYDLRNDPDERIDLAESKQHTEIAEELSQKIDEFFAVHSNPRWNLWQGGSVKSNSTRPFFWQDIWGEDWTPSY